MATSATKAKSKYNAKAYDRIAIYLKAGEKESIKAEAERQGYNSINDFVNAAIKEKIEK